MGVEVAPAQPIQLGFQTNRLPDRLMFVLPPRLLELEEVNFFLEAVKERKLWQEIGKGNFVIVDLRHGQCLFFQKGEWLPQIPLAEFYESRVSSLLILTSSLVKADNKRGFEFQLPRLIETCLPQHHAAVFIYEERDGEVEKKWRKNIFKKAGLVETKIFTPRGQSCLLWEARRPKERACINLTLRPWFWPMFERMMKRYAEIGFELVIPERMDGRTSFISLADLIGELKGDYQKLLNAGYQLPEILVRSQHSKFVPGVTAALKDGCGVWLRNAKCGKCVWEISFRKGMVAKITDCGDRDCEAFPPQLKKKQQYHLGETQLPQTCGNLDCGVNLIQTVVRKKEYRNGMTSIIIEIKCPHCGVKSVEEDYVPTKSLISSTSLY